MPYTGDKEWGCHRVLHACDEDLPAQANILTTTYANPLSTLTLCNRLSVCSRLLEKHQMAQDAQEGKGKGRHAGPSCAG